MSIPNPEVKKLYSRSAGRCNICEMDLFLDDIHIGEMAHIIAKSSKGPRGSEHQVNLNSYENLILLCANDHTKVDKKPSVYPAEELRSIKKSHEQKVSSIFNNHKDGRTDDLKLLNMFMNYVPFTQLKNFVDKLPLYVRLDLSKISDFMEDVEISNPHLYPLKNEDLKLLFENFIQKYYELWNVIDGFTLIDGREQSNFSQTVDFAFLKMEKKDLPYEEVIKLNKDLNQLKVNFNCSYSKFLSYLKIHYKEVSLDIYAE